MTMYMITIALIGYLRPGFLPTGPQTSWRERFAGLRNIWAPALLFVFVIGGLYGLPFLPRFTPTEAGGVGATGAFLIGVPPDDWTRKDPHLAAASDPHRRCGVHRADRRLDLRIFPHGDANPAKGHGTSHRPRSRPLRASSPSSW